MGIDFLRSFCLDLPACKEDIKWGNNLVFSVGNKMFCVAGLDQPFKCSFKVKDEEFDELTSQPNFEPTPYLARAKWVLVSKPNSLYKDEWEHFISQSYKLVIAKFSKKVRAELGL